MNDIKFGITSRRNNKRGHMELLLNNKSIDACNTSKTNSQQSDGFPGNSRRFYSTSNLEGLEMTRGEIAKQLLPQITKLIKDEV